MTESAVEETVVASEPGTDAAAEAAEGSLARTPRAPRVVEGRAERVTLYEDRAEVRRLALVRIDRGSTWVALTGITPYVDDRSVQVRLDSDETEASVAAARVVRRLVLPAEYASQEIAELELARDAARRRMAEAAALVTRLERRRDRLGKLMRQWAAGLAQVPRDGAQDELAAWRKSYTELDAELRATQDAWHGALAARTRASDEADRATARRAVRLQEQPRMEARIEIQLVGADAGEGILEVAYRTPCAMWRPEHLASVDMLKPVALSRGGGKASALDAVAHGSTATLKTSMTVQTFATVWQATGEHWEGVELVLSTARPGQAASPPPVRDDRLHSRKKTHEEQRSIVVESRDQTIETTGAAGARQVDEMPGVDDGGEPLEFRAREPVTLASTGEPVRVEIGRVELDAELDRVLRPERSGVAHIRARARWSGAYPLLAGPLRVVRGGALMGRASQRFVAAGEPFELGLGPDDAIRVRRKVRVERDTTRVSGTQTVDVTVDLFLSNLSDATRHVLVTERLPLSEIEGLTVSLREAHGFTLDEAEGMLRCPLQLGPHATEALTVVFRIKAPAKMVLPF